MTFTSWPVTFRQDVVFGLRNLLKAPGFAAVAIGSIALGIAASAAMYSVIYGVVLNPFAYKDVDRLMSIQVRSPDERSGNGSYYTVDQFVELSERTKSAFEGVIASTISDVTWTGAGEPLRLRGNHGTFNTFEVMGVPALIGRVATPADAHPDAEAVVVLGYTFWQRQFGGDPGVLGRKLRLNDKTRTVIGVMPSRFMWRGADVYLPLAFRRGEMPEGVEWVHAIGRLRSGVTSAQAEAEIRPVIEDLARRQPDAFAQGFRLTLTSFEETFPSGIREALWTLFGAVGLLLLIACVNVSGLLLSRGVQRQREMAIRAAMGAGRARLVSQLLAESLVLGITGGLFGLVLAYAGLNAIVAIMPPNTVPAESEIVLNGPVLLFAFVLSTASAILFGLAPALHMSRRDLVTPLREAGRAASSSLGHRRIRSVLIVGEVALSLMLLLGAALMVRTLVSLQHVSLTMIPERILTLRVPFSDERYPEPGQRVRFMADLLSRLSGIPGITGVGLNTTLHPLGGGRTTIDVVGSDQKDERPVIMHETNEAYADVMGIPTISGHFFTEQEVRARASHMVINQALMRRYFGESNPIGRLVRIPALQQITGSADATFEIVGVVKDTVNRLFTNETLPELFIPYTHTGAADRLALFGPVTPESLQKAVQSQVYAIDASQPVMDLKRLDTLLDEGVFARPRFNLLLFAVFAGLGLVLALIGIYGVISNMVAQRRREIGIRLALGATGPQILAMVLKTAGRLLAAGIAIGLIGSVLAANLLRNMVLNVSTLDPYSFAAVSILILAAGLFAGFLPALRAAAVDPLATLRDE